MWLLLIASFISTVITIERLFTWLKYTLASDDVNVQNCFSALEQQDTHKALQFCQRQNTPRLKMLIEGIQALPFIGTDKMSAYADAKIDNMARGQSVLDTIITMAPMLGILGTVLGIIDSFHILSLQGVDDPTAVVGGIAQALISTAMGLCVALLALLPYNLFRSFLQKLTLRLECVGTEFNHLCQQNKLITEPRTLVNSDPVIQTNRAENVS